jgi:hypothetical protein
MRPWRTARRFADMHKHTYTHWLTGALVVATVSFPAAAQGRIMTDSTGHPSAPAPAPRAAPAQADGFQWDDAGIGAAGTVILLGAGALTAGVARRRRTQHAVAA